CFQRLNFDEKVPCFQQMEGGRSPTTSRAEVDAVPISRITGEDSLARDLKESPEKPRFDHALNTLLRSGGDQVTRQNLLEAIRKELPALPLQQAEQHLRRSFRHKVNSLRCLGQKVLLTLLQVQFVSENPSKRRRRDLPGNAEEMVV
ncbi:unnamed protein product, partial [Durusdinium trenchii]